MHQEFRVGDIRPNPYRHIDRYPMIPEKVEALEESYDRTGFWDNIVVRINADGQPEQAYGHHRVTALLNKYGPDYRASFIVKDFGEADMLRAMADENGEVYGANAAVDIETLRSLLGAWSDGILPLPVVSAKATKAHAYSAGGQAPSITYVPKDVADFFGWPIDRRTDAAIAGLEAIESGGMKIEAFEGVSIRKAHEAAKAVNTAVKVSGGDKAVVAKTVAAVTTALKGEAPKGVATGRRTASEQAIKDAGQAALVAAMPRAAKAPKPVFVADTIASIETALRFLDRGEIRSKDGSVHKLSDLIEELAKHPELGRDYEDVARLLRELSDRAAALAALFVPKQIGKGN